MVAVFRFRSYIFAFKVMASAAVGFSAASLTCCFGFLTACCCVIPIPNFDHHGASGRGAWCFDVNIGAERLLSCDCCVFCKKHYSLSVVDVSKETGPWNRSYYHLCSLCSLVTRSSPWHLRLSSE